MAYTFEQFEKDHFFRKIPKMLQDEEIESKVLDIIFKNVPLDELISRLFDNEQLRQLFVQEFVTRLSLRKRLEGIPLDERLKGLSPDEIKAYLQKIESDNGSQR